jgi:hypothetical protein
MKVLFVPYSSALSHIIPLLALNRKLSGSAIETAFLSPSKSRPLLKQLGVNVLDIDHDGLSTGVRTEIMAYGIYQPDVVVDDASISTGYATVLTGRPRVAIQRTGMFPGGTPRNKAHRHSLGWLSNNVDNLPDASYLGLPKLQKASDVFKADIKVVPGIRSLEVLPPGLEEDQTYYYSGPLLMDDYLMQRLGSRSYGRASLDDFQNFETLRCFLDANRRRKIVYVTFGTVAVPTEPLLDCLRYLLDNDIAIVSNIEVGGLSEQQQRLYYFASYLPMHLVCSRVDLMIHQCGSGTYHYPIIHNVAMITIGTKCYDREDVALRLMEQGASVHLPSPDECADFTGSFKCAVGQYFHESGVFMKDKKANLERLNLEIQQTVAAFKFEEVLEAAVDSAAIRKRAKSLSSHTG